MNKEKFVIKLRSFNDKFSLKKLLTITFVANVCFTLAYFLLPRYDDVFFGEYNWENYALSQRIKPYCAALQYSLLAISFVFWTWTLFKYGNNYFADMASVLLGFAPVAPAFICVCWFVIYSIKSSKKDEPPISDSPT